MTEMTAASTVLETAVDRLYRNRFPPKVLARRQAVWKTLCRSWFQRFVPSEARVLEIAPGYCEFINNIQAAERVAVDLNPETRNHAAPDVVVHKCAAERLGERVPQKHFDVAFMSNFLEHCRSRDQMLSVLHAVRLSLKPGGRLMILGPNFRYCFRDYFDYLDHYLPLTEKAVVEALHLAGYSVESVQPRTLPYTFRGSLPSWLWLVKLYLKLPVVWRLFGAQFFVVARTAAAPQSSYVPRPHLSRRALPKRKESFR